jgi:pectin methylesterase-like acyl-CoA thioesterase
MLNDRKRFVCSAAMAAVFVLLAGVANALAAPTVRCVPNYTINSSCTPTVYPTISAAVSAAASGDIILVAPGTYPESVTVSKPLSLRRASWK